MYVCVCLSNTCVPVLCYVCVGIYIYMCVCVRVCMCVCVCVRLTQDDQRIYTILEYAARGDFFGFVKTQKFSEDVTKHYFKQLLEGDYYYICVFHMHCRLWTSTYYYMHSRYTQKDNPIR